METPFTRHAQVQVPLLCGPMYPCSNPELVAAVSEAGGLGIVQPIALTYVHGHDFREGLRFIKQRTSRPIGFNALIEGSNRLYRQRMELWIDIALEEGVRFFLTSLGNPHWVCNIVHAAGGVVYHDVTERKWAQKGIDGGVDGLIAVNARAGGHAGGASAEKLFDALAPLGLPIVSAGGVSTPEEFTRHLRLGYAAVQVGTRFIATPECSASDAYKRAIVDAHEDDIVRTERLTGVPVAVIRNAYIDKLGTDAGWFAKWMLRGRRTKHWMRTWYALNSVRRLKHSLTSTTGSTDYWQAGKSVTGIHAVRPAAQIVAEFARALD